MFSIDANLLLYSYSESSPAHAAARAFIEEVSPHEDVALSEFVTGLNTAAHRDLWIS